MQATYHFHGDLASLLRRRWRAGNPITQPVRRTASIKDVIESFGLPHTEVESITCDGRSVDFSWPVEANQHFAIFPVPTPWDVTRPTLLRPAPLNDLRFIVDVNVGRLARYLRMAGFDTLHHPGWDDRDILQALGQEQRILLSRNLDLLKRKQVVFGRAIRSNTPPEQLREVLDLFGIDTPDPSSLPLPRMQRPPRTRAQTGNLHRLEPLTIRFFDTFHLCPRCDKIYWAGSHVDRMRQTLNG
jgi:uncharacterized protein